MRILIASGIYPPDIGGPAQYARNLFETWRAEGHDVKVAAYRWERAFPPLFRHLLYLSKIVRKGWNADLILVLDTWSAAVPTMVACKLMGKKYMIRTGGDHLWESYVERTGKMVLFRNFYDSEMGNLTFKERLFFKWGRATMRNAGAVIFSTEWQKNIFEKVYGLNKKKIYVVGDFCGNRAEQIFPENRTFIVGTRSIKYKNIDLLSEVFEYARSEVVSKSLCDIDIDKGKAVYDSFFEKIHRSYAVILASLSDISPALIFDSIRAGVPFIVTKENGINEIIKDAAIYVDPLSRESLKNAIVWLSEPENREIQAKKVSNIKYLRTWNDIAKDLVDINFRVHDKR